MANFNFDEYNAVMKNAGGGLKLLLIEQLLEDVEKTCRRFNNPLKKDVSDLLDEVTQLRGAWKKQALTQERTTSAMVVNAAEGIVIS